MLVDSALPQTPTTMEAAMKLAAGSEAQFWHAQERMEAIAAAQPGFSAVIGGPIVHSSWMYFCGKFETPDEMSRWHESRQHAPVIDKAYSTWFDAFYIRKWRLPEVGEKLAGPLFCETAISTNAAFDEATTESVFASIVGTLPEFGPQPFETLAEQFEQQPFQLVGPLQEFPKVAPVRYLLLSHWDNALALSAWLASKSMRALSELGAVDTDVHLLIRHRAGERQHQSPDGSHRSWSRHGSAAWMSDI